MSENQNSSHAITTVTVTETGEGLFTNKVETSNHAFLADEPVTLGGQDRGPAPFELLLASLGACTSMTLRMYADRKKWPLEKTKVRLSYSKETNSITRDIVLQGALDAEQRQRLLEIADKCPVHRTLTSNPSIASRLAE